MKYLPFLILLIACTANQAQAEQQVPSPIPPLAQQRQAAADAPVYHPVKAAPRPDYTVFPIPCEEPIKPRDFPPLPDRLEFSVTGTQKDSPEKLQIRREFVRILPDRNTREFPPAWTKRVGDFGPPLRPSQENAQYQNSKH
jgi:hypothetical protein